jgi:N-methylhydantoinase A
MESAKIEPIRIGIDIGGTFTDFIVYCPTDQHITTYKIPSTPHNPALAVLEGLKYLNISGRMNIIHGSTVATNTLLERKGAKTAFITTWGFKDLLLIGRQNRSSLYDWNIQQPPPLIPADLSYEVKERIDCYGNILQPLDEKELEPIISALISKDVQSVAISLLFSFLHPEHEQAIVKRLLSAKVFVSASSNVLPEFREYERASTTAVNAYVSPILDKYLSTLEENIPEVLLQVMQSNGGMISLDEARKNGVRCILSGPAGGVVGSQHLSHIAQLLHSGDQNTPGTVKLITFDMGGTSTDVSLIDQKPHTTNEITVSGCPISIPMLDIHTIGAGGGSIAYVDPGGALRVGPHSAGAEPGPACYGRGDLPTVTDANLVLGRLLPEFFLGGKLVLDPKRSWWAIEQLGAELGMNAIQCALGIITVANAHMERALRVISVEQGHDPHEFTLFSFGGAGGLHAVELARNLNIPYILISPYASVLSAFGMLVADTTKDYVKTVMLDNACSLDIINAQFQPLVDQGLSDILCQGVDPKDIYIQKLIDARYQGQSYELTVPFDPRWDALFHTMHEQTYGYKSFDTKLELVNIRVRAIGKITPPQLCVLPSRNEHPDQALICYRDTIYPDYSQSIPIFQHEALRPGNQITGPAMIVRPDTTVLIGNQDVLSVDGYQNLWITIGSTLNK